MAGGLGFEKDLLGALGGHSVFLVGSGYDLKREKFGHPGRCEFIGEHFNHHYARYFEESDLLIDVSDSLKSKYTVNDISIRSRKPSMLLLHDGEWMIAVIRPDVPSGRNKACLECRKYYGHPGPAVVQPAVAAGKAVELLSAFTGSLPHAGLYGMDGQLRHPLDEREDCGVSQGHYRFATGEYADVVSVSCSEKSVAISPMNEVSLDLERLRTRISPYARVEKITAFFLEIRFRHYHMIVFRQARAVVKGSKDKNLALALYRAFVGS